MLEIHPEVDHANVEAGLIGSIDDSGNRNGIEIAADSSCFIEDRLVGSHRFLMVRQESTSHRLRPNGRQGHNTALAFTTKRPLNLSPCRLHHVNHNNPQMTGRKVLLPHSDSTLCL